MKEIIKNKLLNAINEGIQIALYEELSISNEVTTAANNLKNAIIQNLNFAKNSSKIVTIYNDDNTSLEIPCTYKENEIKVNIFNEDVIIQYKIYTSGIRYIKCDLIGQTEHIDEGFVLKLNLAMFNGKTIPNYFENTINHELLHLYQYHKSKKEMLLNNYERMLYNSVKTFFKDYAKLNKDTNDKINKKQFSENDCIFANALYATFNCEQDAFIHGMYSYLKTKDLSRFCNNYSYELKNTIEYQYIDDLKYAIKNIDKFPENEFHINKEKALFRFNKALNRFQTKIGKMTLKIENSLPSNELIPSHFCDKHPRSY